jgi:hypothetical protein
MKIPLVAERVWVSGHRDESIVSGANYATNLNTAEPVADGESLRQDTPLQALLALREIEAAQAHRSSLDAARGVLRASERHFYRSRESIWHLREMLRAIFACIHQSQVLIAESDQLIARSLTLGCDRYEER